MKNGSIKFLKEIDQFSLPFEFRNRYKTNLGGCLTLIYYIIAFLVILSYINYLFSKSNPSISTYNKLLDIESFNHSIPIQNEILEIQFNSINFTKELISKLVFSMNLITDNSMNIPVNYTNCNNNSNIDSQIVCLRFDFLSNQKYFQILKDEIRYLKLNMMFNCSTSDCRSDNYYLKKILGLKLNGVILDTIINPLNLTSSVSSYKKTIFSETLNSQFFPSFDINFKQSTLIEDDSIFFTKGKEKINKNYLSIINSMKNYLIYEGNFVNQGYLPLTTINLNLQTNMSSVYLLKYPKFVTLLVEVIALLFLLYCIIHMILYVFTDKMRRVTLLNHIYDFYDKNDKSNLLKTKQFLKNKSKSFELSKEKLLPLPDISAEDDDIVKVIDQSLNLDLDKKESPRKNVSSIYLIQPRKTLEGIEEEKEKVRSIPSQSLQPFDMRFNAINRFKMTLEKIEEENYENQEFKRSPKTKLYKTTRPLLRDIQLNPKSKNIKRLTQYIPEQEENLLSISDNDSQDEKKANKKVAIIDDILIMMNTKAKLVISNFELIFISCGIHRCFSNCLKKKNNLYELSYEKAERILDSNYMIEKLYEVEKLKFLLFNDYQNYAFSFLTKPLIITENDEKVVVQNDIIKKNKDFRKESQNISKEECIKYLLDNTFTCTNINDKLFNLIKTNN